MQVLAGCNYISACTFIITEYVEFDNVFPATRPGVLGSDVLG